MPRRGENIRKRADGRWEGRYKCMPVTSGAKTCYKSIYGKSYGEVKQRLLLIRQETLNNTVNCPMVHTFSECMTLWLTDITQRCKYSTCVKYQYICDCHLKRFACECPVSEITNEMCEKYLIEEQSFEGRRLSLSTMKTICHVINQILKYGESGVKVSLPEKITLTYKYSSKEIAVFSVKEQRRLLDFLYDQTDRYKLGILICLFSGLRLGEICALRIKDIDLLNKCIRVSQTVQRIRSNGEHKTILYCAPPKSADSIRTIPLCDALLELLIKMDVQGEYLLNGKSLMEPRTYQYMFSRYLKTAFISNKNFHSLRHTFATNCIGSGMDAKCLSEILGHSDVKTTMNRYVHPSMDSKRHQMNKCFADYGQNIGHLS